jgi:hypothetical protein
VHNFNIQPEIGKFITLVIDKQLGQAYNLFNLLRRQLGRNSDYLHLVIGNVGDGINLKINETVNTP